MPQGRLAVIVASVASAAVLAIFLANALTLATYPFDWGPDEGLLLDYARRILTAPATLYPASLGPFPCIYTPLVPLMLAPIAAYAEEPLVASRFLALFWTGIIATVAGHLVARRSGRAMGLACAALLFAPLDVSYWHMLVRADEPMLALWLLAAAILLPERLARGADRLAPRRLIWGAGFLLLSVLAKPTAVLYGAPLVLGWLIVDPSSAARLAALVGASGLATFGALEWATEGGFRFALGLYGLHAYDWRTIPLWMGDLLGRTWPIFVLALIAVWRARREIATRTDAAWLLVLGGALAIPTLAKYGAYWNYLLPLLAGTVILTGRIVPRASGRGGAAIVGLTALSLAAVSRFPLPTAEDEKTAAAYAAYIERVGRKPGPLLLLRSDSLYFRTGRPVEMGATDFRALADRNAPGIERVLERLERREYALVAGPPGYFPDHAAFQKAMNAYQPIGACDVAFFYGRERMFLVAPPGTAPAFEPPPDSRCRAWSPQ